MAEYLTQLMQVWAGNPATKFRDMKPAEKAYVATSATNYSALAAEYK